MRRVHPFLGLLLVSIVIVTPASGHEPQRGGSEALVIQAGDVGYLSVASDPPAKISIDGKDTGKTIPADKVELAVGHHQLTFVSLDGKLTRTLGFNITKTET